MRIEPTQYNFTINDRQRIVDLGYIINHSCSVSLEDFMVTEFANFDLVSVLKELENSFTPTTNLTITREISYDEQPPMLHISYINCFSADEEALIFDRTFSKTGAAIKVDHNCCVLPLKFQGQGVVKNVLQVSLQQYINMGAKTIHVSAGLNAGGHVWARYGFVAFNKVEVEAILNDAKKRLSNPEYELAERIFNIYYSKSPYGKAFPMTLWAKLDFMAPILIGSRWRGEINLDNSIQSRNFIDYVFRD